MEFLILGIIVALNIIIIKMKFDKARHEDAIFDVLLLVLVTVVLNGSFAGLMVGAISSLFISIFLLASPPTFFSGLNGVLTKFQSKAKRKRPKL